MAAFQDTKDQVEQKVIMHLLNEIERNPEFTQRKLANELGIALGLINRYLKAGIAKGWIRMSQVSPKRIGYFLTPEGFMEKSQMVAGYLTRSLTFFRDARDQCEIAFEHCAQQGWYKIALLGEGDLADIAKLVAQGSNLSVEIFPGSIVREENREAFSAIRSSFDAFLITDVMHPQNTYDHGSQKIDKERLLILPLLYISQKREAA